MFKLRFLAFACAALASTSIFAADFYVLKRIPSITVTSGGPAAPAPTITLSANTLPEGLYGQAYSADLKPFVQVTGGPGISAAQFALGGGSLPTGLSLSSDGVVSGTPTAFTADEGANFTVVGTYVTASGQQAYTIVVGAKTLDVTHLTGGTSHTCAITTSGAAKCWGSNSQGQLGSGDTQGAHYPKQVVGLTAGVQAITAGDSHTCAINSAGAAVCWGGNGFGQLGDGSYSPSNTPVAVTGLVSGVKHIATRHHTVCVVNASNAALCWGQNANGQVGDNTLTTAPNPVQVVGLTSGATDISVSGVHACAVVDGAAKCWGAGTSGQLGHSSSVNSLTPVQVTGLTSGVTKVSAGGNFSCAVVAGGARCWGVGANGLLGDGLNMSKNSPVQVSGLTAGVTHITSGSAHSCAIVSGSAQCWGRNNSAQLGLGHFGTASIPEQVEGLTSGVTQINAGSNHTCAAHNGIAKCWGTGNGYQLGNGEFFNQSIAVKVKSLD